jgi:hypothetical protein
MDGWMDGWSVDKTPWFSFSSCSQLTSPIAESSTDVYGMASKWMNGKVGVIRCWVGHTCP